MLKISCLTTVNMLKSFSLISFSPHTKLLRDALKLKISRDLSTKSDAAPITRLPTPKLFKFKQNEQNNSRKVTSFGWIMLLIPLTTFSLGCWQVQRKKWKEQLIDDLDVRTNSSPADLPDDLCELESMEYKTVRVRGKFLHEQELIMGPRSLIQPNDEHKGGILTQQDSSIGYLIITPFQIEGRDNIILVNRGWVAKNNLNPNTRQEGQIRGLVEVAGVVRNSENRPQFAPKQSGQIFMHRDLPLMCRITGTDPVFLDAVTTVKGGPIGGQTRVTLRNEHLSYIVTWFSLSAVTSYLWYRQIFRRINR